MELVDLQCFQSYILHCNTVEELFMFRVEAVQVVVAIIDSGLRSTSKGVLQRQRLRGLARRWRVVALHCYSVTIM